MNKLKTEIFNEQTEAWEDFTPYTVNNSKTADLLDEQLDEASLTLIRVPQSVFMPLTQFRITVINAPKAEYNATMAESIAAECGFISAGVNAWKSAEGFVEMTLAENKITQKSTRYYLLASDDSTEAPTGSGKYNHEIYLIETTKFAEGFIGDSVSFTNALGNDYVNEEPGENPWLGKTVKLSVLGGRGTSDGTYIYTQWHSQSGVLPECTVVYNGEYAYILGFDASTDNVTIKYLIGGEYAGHSAGTVLDVEIVAVEE